MPECSFLFKDVLLIMKFKIDTNPGYTRILPEDAILSATMAEEIIRKCQELQGAEALNFIVDFSGIEDGEAADATPFFEALVGFHETRYEAGSSLIFTGIGPQLLAQMKRDDLHHILNITPTLQEAIEMVNMEIMERDLFNEEL